MDKYIIIFQGQGSISPEMVTKLSKNPLGKKYLEHVKEIIHGDLLNISYEEIQSSIAYSSVITFLYGMVCYKEYRKSHSLKPALLLGHSMGEYTALAAAEAITVPDTIKILNERSRLVDRIREKTKGCMLVITNVERKRFLNLIRDYEEKNQIEISLACVNGKRQFCVCGEVQVLKKFLNYLTQLNIRAKLLKNTPPFHTKMMQSGKLELLEILKSVPFAIPEIPVLSCVLGNLHTTEERIHTQLCEHLVKPVEWNQSVEFCEKIGADQLVEMGEKSILGNFSYTLKRAKFSVFLL